MPEPRHAVFLSYAREDAEPVRRIAEALRTAGVEVWHDQSELRGGDAWDAKIRKQIHECVIFVPIVSANTQARKEGYFRREWRLAVDRTHDMSASVAFIVPVVIDDTRQASADVPEEFLRYQWTNLPGGAPSPQFVGQVSRLLDPSQQASGRQTADDRRRTAEDRQRTTAAASQSGSKKLIAATAVVLVIGVGGYFALRPATKPFPNAANPELKTQNSEPTNSRVADSKSIAVLPFANLSDDKDANVFFSDGIHEDILTNLSNIRELRVVSRTSVLGYRATTKKMAEIAKELGVAYILEGSVRRAGNKVRVTGQLIRAATDEHLWAKNYDRDLTDIFAIQSELSQAIAAELKAAISPEEIRLLDQRPTASVAAYELVLKARQIRDSGSFLTDLQRREQLLLSAIQLDPSYAVAYADLSFYYVGDAQFASGRKDLKKAREALDRAVQLAPNLPDVIRAQADYLYYGEYEYGRALEVYEKFARFRPNDPAYFNRVGAIQRRQARYPEALRSWRRLEEIDPANIRNVRDLGVLLSAGRRFGEAIAQAQKLVERLPTDLNYAFERASLAYVASGSTREVDAFLGGLTPEQASALSGIDLRRRWALLHGEVDEAIRLDQGTLPGNGPALAIAAALASRGDMAAARTRLGNLGNDLRARMDAPDRTSQEMFFSWAEIAAVEALLGHNDEAVRLVRKAVETTPESRDSLLGANVRAYLAFVCAWAGDKDTAIAELAHALRTPFGYLINGAGQYNDLTVHTLRRDPRFAPLRGDPRFEALLNDPKNNAPLF